MFMKFNIKIIVCFDHGGYKMLRSHADSLGLCNHLAGNLEYQLFIYIDMCHLFFSTWVGLKWVIMGLIIFYS